MKRETGTYGRKNRLLLPVGITVLTVLLSAALAFVFFRLTRDTAQPTVAAANDVIGETVEDLSEDKSALLQRDASDVYVEPGDNEEMRAVWIATTGNLNYPSRTGLSAKQLAAELDGIVETCRVTGLNAIFFQVRPTADALYPSDVFPWSHVLTGTQGQAPEDGFDSLGYLLAKAHEHGIAVHAWVNPFRITNGSVSAPQQDLEKLAPTHPARLHPEYAIAYADGKLYFDPGNPGAREVILSGITELCTKYPDLDGIHLDDFFYPYPSGGADFDDGASYAAYGEGRDKADWRRENVNTFIRAAYDTIKAINVNCRFGVSPFGIWANSTSTGTRVRGSDSKGFESYFSQYCDSLAWAQGGYVDYLAPQDYWSFTTAAAPFDDIARWWNANLDGTGVDLYLGLAAYQAPTYGENEIPMQVVFSRQLLTCRGCLFFGYADIVKNSASIRDRLRDCFSYGIRYTPVVSDGSGAKICYPNASGTTTSDSDMYLLGVSDPAYPVSVNGVRVSRTKDGYFSAYVSLSDGGNSIVLEQNGVRTDFRVNKSTGKKATPRELTDYVITEPSPSGETWVTAGDVLKLSCSAPSGSRVTATIGSLSVDLAPTLYSASTDKNYREVYKGSITMEDFVTEPRGTFDIGSLTFTATKGSRKASKTVGLVRELGEGAYIYAEVVKDYAYIKNSPTSSFYDDPSPMSIGMRDYITGYTDGYYRLKCGYYMSADDVEVVTGSALYENRILSAVVENNTASTKNNVANHTDIRFSVLENVPVDVQTLRDTFTITFFNTDAAFLPDAQVARNPLVRSVSTKVVNGNPVYVVHLKAGENYYGFHTIYEDGMIVFRLNNPQSLEPGDKPLEGKVIVVDAGHGGVDTGAPGPDMASANLHEAALNLAIALELRDRLEELGATVLMTRESDVTVELLDRVDFLASMIPDMAISIHHNSTAVAKTAQSTRGYLGLYSDCAGILLAGAVSDTVCRELNRLQRKTGYQMLAVARNHRYPSTLCEMSFISNIEEFQWTITPGNIERSGRALADGVLEFYRRQEKYLLSR